MLKLPFKAAGVLVTAVLVVGMVGACAPAVPTTGAPSATSPAPDASRPGDRPLVEVVEPPDQPPVARAARIVAVPINTDWQFPNGTRKATAPDGELSAFDLPVVSAETAKEVSVEIDSPVRPTQVDLVVYDKLDEEGAPIGEGRELRCLHSDDCKLKYGDAKLALTTPINSDSTVLVLHLYYAVIPTAGGSPTVETNYASYAWRIT